MSAEKLRSYHFATAAQWARCLLTGEDPTALRDGKGARPFPPYQRTATRTQTDGGHAPVVTRLGEILWRDQAGALHRLLAHDDVPTTSAAPDAIARAERIVTTPGALWPLRAGATALQRFDEASLTSELTVDFPGARIIDVAPDGGHLRVLVARGDALEVVRCDRDGHVAPTATVALAGITDAKAFVFLRTAGRFVVLAGGSENGTGPALSPRLVWISAETGRQLRTLLIGGMRPCFAGNVLGSDSRARVYLAGREGEPCGGGAWVVSFDGDGNALGEVPLAGADAPATGVTATPDALWVTDAHGLLRFGVADVIPDDATGVECTSITPALDSPDREDGRRWLRVEAAADLPAGTTLEVAVAATDDAAVRDALNAIAADQSIPASLRVQRLLAHPDVTWRPQAVFQGIDRAADEPAPLCAAKLFDVPERYLWVAVTQRAAPGARLPRLARLDVRYPGRTLMEHLPSIYQREEARPDSFLRALVGVLETTTQGLDERIGAMGSHLVPATADGPWMDFVARWLGVPWDDALSDDQKRRILQMAEELARGRGTRAGLEALLACLLGDEPRRFRVTDTTADFGFAVLGGATCTGSALPAMLGGRTRWSPELGSSAVLGHVRLPCEGQREDGAWQLAGRIRVDVAATAAERRAWEPWLRGLIEGMVPVTARLELRWVGRDALHGDRLDGTLTLRSAPAPHLGTDAVTGVARLPEGATRLGASGSTMSTRLR